MTQHEPDWADEVGVNLPNCMCNEVWAGDTNHHDQCCARRWVAAALRAERERCAGLCRAEIDPGPETDTQFDLGWVAGAGFIEDRIRSGEQA